MSTLYGVPSDYPIFAETTYGVPTLGAYTTINSVELHYNRSAAFGNMGAYGPLRVQIYYNTMDSHGNITKTLLDDYTDSSSSGVQDLVLSGPFTLAGGGLISFAISVTGGGTLTAAPGVSLS